VHLILCTLFEFQVRLRMHSKELSCGAFYKVADFFYGETMQPSFENFL
jgi:hypothetical protein